VAVELLGASIGFATAAAVMAAAELLARRGAMAAPFLYLPLF